MYFPLPKKVNNEYFSEEKRPTMARRSCNGLVVADFLTSFMWVWSSVLIKLLVQDEILRYGVYIVNLFLFAYLAEITGGGSYNPLSILAASVTGDFLGFIFTLGARIPAQVFGSVCAVRLIMDIFPGIKHGPRLHVDIAKGALTEGFLTFTMAIISLGLARKITDKFITETWISSVSKLTLHMLGSDLTGGYMNPVSVIGWAFAYGEHISKEHIVVYWLAPLEATLAAVWVVRILVHPKNEVASAVKHDSLKQKMD